MLALKLLLTPLFIGLASLAGRRWGPLVSGWLIGLPLTSAPVALFLALEQGTEFASRAAQGVLAGQISQVAFCVVYAWLSFRIGWLVCWLVGWGTFFTSTFILEHVLIPLPLAFAGVVSILFVALLLWPRMREKVVETKASAWEIIGRMVAATCFVLVLTSVAGILGPHLSGLLSPLPIYATIFAIFTQRFQGAASARHVLHGVVVSSFACAVFFLVVAGLLVQWGVVAAFSCAVLAALLMQGSLLWLLRPASRKLA
jgi:hypothetical protein